MTTPVLGDDRIGTPAPPPTPRRRKKRRLGGTILALGLPMVLTAALLMASLKWIDQLPTEYTATSSVAFSAKANDRGLFAGGEAVANGAGKFVVFVDSEQTINVVASTSGMTADELKSTAAVVVPGTATLSISVTDGSASRASIAANAFAAQVLLKARDDTAIVAEQFIPAVPPQLPSGPQTILLTAVAGLISLLLGTVALILCLALLRFTRTRPRGSRLPDWMRGPTA